MFKKRKNKKVQQKWKNEQMKKMKKMQKWKMKK